MNKGLLALLATTAVVAGLYGVFPQGEEKSTSFLSAPKSKDPCDSLNYMPDDKFATFYHGFQELGSQTAYIKAMRTEIKTVSYFFTPEQAVYLVKSAGCDLQQRIDLLKIIGDKIVYFTTDGIVDILLTTGGDHPDKVTMLKHLLLYIKNITSNAKQYIISSFYGAEYQKLARKVLKNAPGVDCIWGGIKEDVVTFVVDDSGSMGESFYYNGDKTTRMEFVRNSLMQTLATKMRPSQLFNIVVFSSRARKWKSEHVPATTENLEAAIKYVNKFRAGGGTNISDALTKAFDTEEDLKAVYFLSDGFPSYGIQSTSKIVKHLNKLESQKSNHVYVNTISFMMGENVKKSEVQKGKEVLIALSDATKGTFKQMLS